VPCDGGTVSIVKALPLPRTTTPATVAVGSHAGSCSIYQYMETNPYDEGFVAPSSTSGQSLDSAFTLQKLATTMVSRSPVRCMDVSTYDTLPTAVLSTEDGTIAFIKLSSKAASILDRFVFAPEVAQRVAVPPAMAPTAVAFNGFNELLLTGDAFGGVTLYNVRQMTSVPSFAATVEGGSGPTIHAASFWSHSPSSLLLAG
jgi:hypothetical protein